MTESATLLTALRDVLLEHRYLILFAVAIFDGTWSVLAAGVLAATGFFRAQSALAICIISETIGGYLWYAIGYFAGGKSLDWLLRNSPARRAALERLRAKSERATGLVLFVVKVTYSVTTPVLILIGTLKYDLRKFTAINFVGSVIWAGMVFGLGYLVGDRARSFMPLLKSIGHTMLFVVLGGIALFALHRFGINYLRGKMGTPRPQRTG